MQRVLLIVGFMATSTGILWASIVNCGQQGAVRSFNYELEKATEFHCEQSAAVEEMEDLLTSAASAACPDTCNECPQGQTGCSRLAHYDLGTGFSYHYEHQPKASCPGDQMEHKLVLTASNATHWITCTSCSG